MPGLARKLGRVGGAAALVLLGACPTAGMHVPAADFRLVAARQALAPGDTLRLMAALGNPGRTRCGWNLRTAAS